MNHAAGPVGRVSHQGHARAAPEEWKLAMVQPGLSQLPAAGEGVGAATDELRSGARARLRRAIVRRMLLGQHSGFGAEILPEIFPELHD